jgi:transposase-like protein
MTSIGGVSKPTVTAFSGYFRQLVADSLDEQECLIGGPGIIVEVDESKFGKRKYNRGHRVEGVWVVGGIERTEDRKVFVIKVDSRDAQTLLGVLQRFVRPGSIIYSDMWRGYARITEELEMEHHCVNHSVEFVTADGVHTNTIEATWCGMKIMIPKRNRTSEIVDHLWEYVWRKLHKDSLWDSFIGALRDVAYD